jgi:hypothetical protein
MQPALLVAARCLSRELAVGQPFGRRPLGDRRAVAADLRPSVAARIHSRVNGITA